MPVTVNRDIHGGNDIGSALRLLQAFLEQPVSGALDNKGIETEIIKLQTFLETEAKFDEADINTAIDSQMFAAKIIELQVAANLP